MKKPALYLLVSVFSVLLTLLSGLGIIPSIILLFLCSFEKKKILAAGFSEDFSEDLQQLKLAKIISIINIVMSIILLMLAIILLAIFGLAFLDGALWKGVYNH